MVTGCKTEFGRNEDKRLETKGTGKRRLEKNCGGD